MIQILQHIVRTEMDPTEQEKSKMATMTDIRNCIRNAMKDEELEGAKVSTVTLNIRMTKDTLDKFLKGDLRDFAINLHPSADVNSWGQVDIVTDMYEVE